MSLDRFLGLISGEDACNEKQLLVTVLGVRAFTVGLGVIGDLWSRALSSTGKVSREIVFAPEQLVIGTPGFKVPAIETLAIGRIMVMFMINWFSVQVSTDVGLRGQPYRDENLFEVEFRNDLMDSPPAVDWKSAGGEVEVEVDEEEIISQSMGAGEDEGEGEADEGNCNGGD
ncbi:hypothetical protein PPACK8108_LOCUS24284 [Phakopsora pachyrhizi]|uniref:Uncharacterized protein n=1 Tax=Phakopsora pachyrhizi TaxID=170000 RepID=A0AAV0BRP3_PHAPC|nr:hypothetical protein PPACK8108_LOCUS24284 [Phakopsora pachyrhizi]